MRLTRFNPETGEYEYIEKAKTLDELKAQRKAAIQRLGELEENAECRVQNAEWISYISPISLSGDVYYKCSVCGGHDPWQHTTRGRAKFCPNCGAKMKEKNDEHR